MSSLKQVTAALSHNIPRPIEDGWSYLDQIPQEEFYRLVVDGNKIIKEKGPLAYEDREKGCIQSFMLALRYCRRMKGKEITFKDLLSIHALVASHMRRDPNFPKLRYNRPDVRLRNGPSNISRAGILQYLNAIENEGHVIWGTLHIGQYSITRSELPKIKVGLSCATNEALADQLYRTIGDSSDLFPSNPGGLTPYYSPMAAIAFLKSYYMQCDGVENTIDKIRLMITVLCQPLEVMHIFTDCNLRTSIILILNTLLMNEGLPPAIFEDPNRFDFYSVDECVDMALEGMQLTLKLIQEKTLPGFTLSSLRLTDQSRIREITRDVSAGDMLERLLEFTKEIRETSATVQAVYDEAFKGCAGDPMEHLRFMLRASQIGEHLNTQKLMNHFKEPLKPLDECISREGFWYNTLLGPLITFTSEHVFYLDKNSVSEQGLRFLFDKMEKENNHVHVRIGFLCSKKYGPLTKFNLGDIKAEYNCQSNAGLAHQIYHAEDHWPLTQSPLYREVIKGRDDITSDYCLELARKHYEDQIKSAKNYQEKILVIVETIQELCLLVPYEQLNSVKLLPLINKLLVENGLPPTGSNFRYSSDKFILHSPNELAQIVIQECCVSLAVIRNQPRVEPEELASANILRELNDALQEYYQFMGWADHWCEVPFDAYRDKSFHEPESEFLTLQ